MFTYPHVCVTPRSTVCTLKTFALLLNYTQTNLTITCSFYLNYWNVHMIRIYYDIVASFSVKFCCYFVCLFVLRIPEFIGHYCKSCCTFTLSSNLFQHLGSLTCNNSSFLYSMYIFYNYLQSFERKRWSGNTHTYEYL